MVKKPRIYLGLLISFLSAALMAGFAEIFFRLVSPQQLILIRPDIWCPDAGLGWKHCPNVQTRVNSGDGEVSFHTDSRGFRIDPERRVTPPKRRILTIGDSFIEAIQVNDNETVSERLAQLLSAGAGHEIAVVNAGVGQWNPNQYLIQAKRELSLHPYDMGVIFLYLGNDIASELEAVFPPRKPLRHAFALPSSFLWQEIIDKLLYPVNDILETRSHLFIFLKKNFAALLMRLRLTAYSVEPVFMKAQRDSYQWGNTAVICKNIAEEFTKHHIPILFVLIPTHYQVNSEIFESYIRGFGIPRESVDLEQPNRLLTKEMSRLGLSVLDPLKKMREMNAKGISLYGTVDIHLNAAGHLALAQFILSKIESLLGN